MDLCILVWGPYGPPKTHFLQNTGVPFTVSDKTVYSAYRENALSSYTMKGIPEFWKKWILGVHMTQESKCIGPCFWSKQWH